MLGGFFLRELYQLLHKVDMLLFTIMEKEKPDRFDEWFDEEHPDDDDCDEVLEDDYSSKDDLNTWLV